MEPVASSANRRALAGIFLLLIALTAVMTYPQAVHMTSVPDRGDPLLNIWALSWIAHQLPLAPAHLFDANIFHPERLTLLYSESLLVPALTVAPLQWLGVSPVVNYNLLLLSAIVLSGLGTALLLLELTGEATAAAVSAIIFAFLPFRMDHYSHLQLQEAQFIPLTMWALHKTVRTGRLADAARVGLFAALQFLSCVYLGVFLLPYAAVVALTAVIPRVRGANSGVDSVVPFDGIFARRLLLGMVVAALVYLALVAPVGWSYMKASAVVGQRNAQEAVAGSATVWNYLSAPRSSVLYGRWSDTFGSPERRLFPGLVATLLALVGLRRLRSMTAAAYWVALALAFDLSLGFNGLTYPVLWRFVLPFRGLRVPARMGLFVGFSLAVLAGYGVVQLAGAAKSHMRRGLIAAVLSVLVLFECRSTLRLGPLPDSPPEVYADLLRDIGSSPRAALLELPLAREEPTYMYYSTFHWQDLLNGYSGFFPPSYIQLVKRMETFPDEDSLDALRRLGTRYVLIHGELLREHEYKTLASAADTDADLTLLARRPWQDGEVSLYRIAYDVR